MRKITKRSAALVTGSVLAVAGGTAAFAYAQGWFTGSSETKVATSSIGKVTAVVDLRTGGADNNIYPGKTVSITTASVFNPNDFPVQIGGAKNITVAGKPGCTQTEAGFSFTGLTDRSFAKGTATNVALGSITMSKTADKACAGANLIITAELDGEIADASGTGNKSNAGTGNTDAGTGNNG